MRLRAGKEADGVSVALGAGLRSRWGREDAAGSDGEATGAEAGARIDGGGEIKPRELVVRGQHQQLSGPSASDGVAVEGSAGTRVRVGLGVTGAEATAGCTSEAGVSDAKRTRRGPGRSKSGGPVNSAGTALADSCATRGKGAGCKTCGLVELVGGGTGFGGGNNEGGGGAGRGLGSGEK